MLQPDSSKVEIVVSLLENLDNPHHIITSVFIETFTHEIEKMVDAFYNNYTQSVILFCTHTYRVLKVVQRYKKCTRWKNTEK